VAAFYADENVRFSLVVALIALGHDVLTALDDGRANLGIDDPDVLARAVELDRIVLTNNRNDYHRLHRKSQAHAGIITYTNDPDVDALAVRIHASLLPSMAMQLIRVICPP